MSVERGFGIFDITEVLLNRWITSDHARKVFKAIAYLYEVIGNEAPPSSGAQVRAGHDHSGEEGQGGWYITRGCTGCAFGGSKPLWSLNVSNAWQEIDLADDLVRYQNANPTSGTLSAHLVHYASPGIDTQRNGVYWEMRLKIYYPTSAKVPARIKIQNMDAGYDPLYPTEPEVISVDIQPSADLQIVVLKVPVRGDWWNRLHIWADKKEGTGADTALDLYSYVIAETLDVSQPSSGAAMRFDS